MEINQLAPLLPYFAPSPIRTCPPAVPVPSPSPTFRQPELLSMLLILKVLPAIRLGQLAHLRRAEADFQLFSAACRRAARHVQLPRFLYATSSELVLSLLAPPAPWAISAFSARSASLRYPFFLFSFRRALGKRCTSSNAIRKHLFTHPHPSPKLHARPSCDFISDSNRSCAHSLYPFSSPLFFFLHRKRSKLRKSLQTKSSKRRLNPRNQKPPIKSSFSKLSTASKQTAIPAKKFTLASTSTTN